MARKYGNESEEANALRQELLEEEAKKNALYKKIKLGSCLAIGFVSAIMVILNIVSIVKTNNDTAMLNVKLTEAHANLEAKQLEYEEQPATLVYVDPIVNNASEIGQTICDIQNQLSEVTLNEEANNLGITNEHKALLQDMQFYFYGQSAASVTWCKYGEWIYETNYDYEGDVLEIVWLCYDESDTSHNELYAAAVATYSASNNTLNDFNIYYTSWYGLRDMEENDIPLTYPAPGDQHDEMQAYEDSFNTTEEDDSSEESTEETITVN